MIASACEGIEAYRYGTSRGAEIDLLLHLPGGRLWAIEVKRSVAPRPERGFHTACADVNPLCRFVVCPGTERFPLGQDVEALSLSDLATELYGMGKAG